MPKTRKITQAQKNRNARLKRRADYWSQGMSLTQMAVRLRTTPHAVAMFVSRIRRKRPDWPNLFPYVYPGNWLVSRKNRRIFSELMADN